MEALMRDMMTHLVAVQSCQKEMCALELKRADAQKARLKKQLDALLQKFLAKKISKDEFQTKLKEMKTSILKTKVSQDLIKCQLPKCRAQTMKVLETFQAILKKSCGKSPDFPSCKNVKELDKLLTKKDFDVNDYNTFMEVVLKSIG
jgi:hypothetical protein